MLFLVSLLGVAAIGAVTFVGGGEEDDPPPEHEDFDEVEEIEGNAATSDIGALLTQATASAQADSETAEEPLKLEEYSCDGYPGEDQDADEAAEGDRHWDIEEGTAQDDLIVGTDGSDFLIGDEGADQILGSGGADQIEGDEGNDSLAGEAGDDTLFGGDGDDLLAGGTGDDDLFGAGGDDALYGGDGDDSIASGFGDDSADGGAGDDAVHGYYGDDDLKGGLGEDTLFGGHGNDALTGLDAPGQDTAEKDYLNGGAGDDSIIAGGNDVVTSGEGFDQITLGDWIAEDQAVTILDFEEDKDSLVMVYDGADEAPEIEVEPDETREDIFHVVANGVAIAQVHSTGSLTAQDIALVAQETG